MPVKHEKRCPKCGSTHVVPIRYGLPSREMFEEARAGRIALGGCFLSPDSPDYTCDACGYEWRGPGPMPPAS